MVLGDASQRALRQRAGTMMSQMLTRARAAPFR
jgi:hypothetical protein